jgi:hypothetical protein
VEIPRPQAVDFSDLESVEWEPYQQLKLEDVIEKVPEDEFDFFDTELSEARGSAPVQSETTTTEEALPIAPTVFATDTNVPTSDLSPVTSVNGDVEEFDPLASL